VIVRDTQPPIVTCPSGTSVEADANDQAPVPNYAAGASAVDNCTLGANIRFSQSPAAASLAGLGVNTITVSGFDEVNNEGRCTTPFTVIQRTVIAPSSTALNVGFGCNLQLTFSRSVTINNTGGHFNGGQLQWTASTTAAPITLTTASGFEGGTLAFTVNPAGLNPGSYTYYIAITGWNSATNVPAKNSVFQLPVYVNVEPPAVSVSQTKPVSTSWTAFTNTYGHTFAEVKSNSGNIAGMTVTAYPCVNPPTYPRVNFVRRYWKYVTTGAVNVDIRAYFNDSETKPRVVQPNNLSLWQQPAPRGTWYNRGGVSNPGLNYVEYTGVTNLAGNWMVAHPWVQWYPKTTGIDITSAGYNPSTTNITIEWASRLNTSARGFAVERSVGTDPEVNGWEETGFVDFNNSGNYSFTESASAPGRYQYRIYTWDENGIFYESSVVEIETSATIPDGYALAQNYPNPFNPETVISYTIPAAGPVTLKVYDSYWREITTLVDAEKQAGTHDVRFNGADLPSGTYFYRMQAGSYTATRKMSLTK